MINVQLYHKWLEWLEKFPLDEGITIYQKWMETKIYPKEFLDEYNTKRA